MEWPPPPFANFIFTYLLSMTISFLIRLLYKGKIDEIIKNLYWKYIICKQKIKMVGNHIGGVMVSVLASSAVDRGFESRSGQTKNYKIGICCFSDKHAALRRKSKDWLVRNPKNVSEWRDMSTRGLLFQWASTIQI